MKYTKSTDGVMRTTVRIELRLTQKDIEDVAIALGVTNTDAVRKIRDQYETHVSCYVPIVVNGDIDLECNG